MKSGMKSGMESGMESEKESEIDLECDLETICHRFQSADFKMFLYRVDFLHLKLNIYLNRRTLYV